jgi:methylmalonyl-CoA/ethylmalonyl-CoA epimerase
VHVTTSAVIGPYVIAIDHVGVAVPDLEAAKAWYLERLGFPCVHEEVNQEQGVREAMLAVGASGSFIQLLAPLDEHSLITRFLDRHGPGVQQVAYRVRDLDALCAELRIKGTRLLYDEPRGGTLRSRVNFIHPKEAGGVLIELVELAAD